MIRVFYDLKTTGTDYRKHCITQLAALIYVDGMEAERLDYKLRPHPKAQIEPEALKVQGLKESDLAGFSKWEDVYQDFTERLGKWIDKYDKRNKAWLVGFNNRFFDDQFLRKFFELNNDSYFNSWFWGDSLDVMVLASQYLMDRRQDMPNFKLGTVAAELGLNVPDNLHSALADVLLTRKIYNIVTGVTKEPNETRFFYYYDTKTKTAWKQEGDSGERISYGEFRRFLRLKGLKDGPEFIKDELF